MPKKKTPILVLSCCRRLDFRLPLLLDFHVLLRAQKGKRQGRRALGNRIYGCDDCLAVCPWNKFAESAAGHRAFLPRAELAAPSLGDLLALDDAEFRQVFAGSPIKRIGRGRMVRNAAIAAGNSGDQRFRPALERLKSDESAVVAEAAAWALSELAS